MPEDHCLATGPVIDPDSVKTVVPIVSCTTGTTLPGEACTGNASCCDYSVPIDMIHTRLSACMQVSGRGRVCVAECETGSECESGCCYFISVVDKVCAPSSYCN